MAQGVEGYGLVVVMKEEIEILLEKVQADIKWHVSQMERIANNEDPTYNFHLGWVDSQCSVRLRLEQILDKEI